MLRVCWITNDSNTQEQPISRNYFEILPNLLEPRLKSAIAAAKTVLTGDEVGETYIPSA
jgi:hypothetical protein